MILLSICTSEHNKHVFDLINMSMRIDNNVRIHSTATMAAPPLGVSDSIWSHNLVEWHDDTSTNAAMKLNQFMVHTAPEN